MVGYEYKVIPAPSKGLKARGVKGLEARFAHTLEQRMNELAAEGWQYQRSDILPSEERQGLTSTHTVYRSVLVFRREVLGDVPAQVRETPDRKIDVAKPVEPEDSAEEIPELESSEDTVSGNVEIEAKPK